MDHNIKYTFSDELLCGIIQFDTLNIIMDIHDLLSIVNHKKHFIHYDDTKKYPYFMKNNQKISYFEFIFGYLDSDVYCEYKNENIYDIRRTNINIFHKHHNYIRENYIIVDYDIGHIITYGKEANKLKNPVWKVCENQNETKWIMFCEKDTFVDLCEKSYKILRNYEKQIGKRITFSKNTCGYIQTNVNLFIHQIIMDCYGHGKGTSVLSVDHIDRNPLNNRYDNLRIVKHTEQQDNRKDILKGTKRERKKSARQLPDGITQGMMEKYVVYYKECYNKNKDLYREFFKVEKHPKLKKAWCSSKSSSFSIQEKLNNVNDVVRNLEKDIYPDQGSKMTTSKSKSMNHLHIPKYISIRIIRGKPCIIYEKRTPKTEQNPSVFNIKYTISSIPKNNDELNQCLQEIETKGVTKYGEKWPGLICDRK